MASVSGITTISKVFSKLGDNTGSVIPMYAKDFTSDALTSMTYFKDGGNQDGAEKTLEEFGTGILWLGGVPFIKKTVFDNFLYKKKNINPDIDAKRLFSGSSENIADTAEFAAKKAKSLGSAFTEQADILTDTIKNKGLAKNLALGKFAFSTAMTGLALFGLITLKQKRTEKEIEKQVKQKYAKEAVLKNAIKDSAVYQSFKGNDKQQNSPSFTGALTNIGTFFMTNPVANTTLVDGVITGTRLVQAREGERFEVGLKEACELLFIYGLAQPLQKSMESISKTFFNKPIELDYAVLDSSVIKEAIEAEKASGGSSELLKQAKQIVALSGDEVSAPKSLLEKAKNLFKSKKGMGNDNAKKVINFIFDNQDSGMADILKRSGDIATFTTKEGVEQLSLLSSINTDKIKTTAQRTIDVIENAVKNGDTTKYLKQTKLLKGAAIVGNIGISAILMGYLQPKLNLHLRKKFNNGDNTNPAIKKITAEMEQKLAFQGENKIKG